MPGNVTTGQSHVDTILPSVNLLFLDAKHINIIVFTSGLLCWQAGVDGPLANRNRFYLDGVAGRKWRPAKERNEDVEPKRISGRRPGRTNEGSPFRSTGGRYPSGHTDHHQIDALTDDQVRDELRRIEVALGTCTL